jgi:hypothetical protein
MPAHECPQQRTEILGYLCTCVYRLHNLGTARSVLTGARSMRPTRMQLRVVGAPPARDDRVQRRQGRGGLVYPH